MADENNIRTIFLKTIEHITGLHKHRPLGSIPIRADGNSTIKNTIARFFEYILYAKRYDALIDSELFLRLEKLYEEALEAFISFYADPEKCSLLQKKWRDFETAGDDEQRARIITEIWLPEITLGEEEIIARWRLSRVRANPDPIKPEEVTIQLNALYTMPEKVPDNIPADIQEEWESTKESCTRIADYDHPVPIFIADRNNELVNCLEELNRDVSFEKSIGVFPKDFRVLILISISVTHDKLDYLATRWVEWLLKEKSYENLRYLLISETNVNRIKEKLLKKEIPVFSVFGKYARHFNALKYMQLILERAYGIRAGFKLDTDEGVRSEELFRARGKTWFQTLCHELWGGNAVDCHGNEVNLGINEGEYIRGTDIEQFGYATTLRMPEVTYPNSLISSDIFFNKPLAQARGTELYNRFNRLSDYISHPLVKGGGYGITNESLRRFAPFTLSEIGRAEDQQFYFYGLTKGLRGIFHPDLRIAHYKSTVARSEKKTAATRLLGDMYRLIIFEHIVDILEIKYDIDPFPGIFAGGLARAQAFFTILYKSFEFCIRGEDENARFLLTTGLDELGELKDQIASGEMRELLKNEAAQWRKFVEIVERIDAAEAKELLSDMMV
jgi:hypothetical protein